MERINKVRKFKPYIMRYLHSSDPNYEPVLRDLLEHEGEVYEELTKKKKELERGKRGNQTWEVVFAELTDILTPMQIQQLFARLEKDFRATCQRFQEMAEAQILLEKDTGGPG